MTKNKERDQVAVFCAPIFYNNWTWYFLADAKLDPADPNFPNSVVVGAIFGSAPAGWLAQHDFHTKLQPGIDTLPAMLAEHKGITAILATDLVVNEAIRKAGIPMDNPPPRSAPSAASRGGLVVRPWCRHAGGDHRLFQSIRPPSRPAGLFFGHGRGWSEHPDIVEPVLDFVEAETILPGHQGLWRAARPMG